MVPIVKLATVPAGGQESSQELPQHWADLAVSGGPKTAVQRTAQHMVDTPDRIDAEDVRGSKPLPPTTKRVITGRFGCSSHVADRREGKDVRIFADTTVVTVWEQGMETPS
jgi:hypothetical protein